MILHVFALDRYKSSPIVPRSVEMVRGWALRTGGRSASCAGLISTMETRIISSPSKLPRAPVQIESDRPLSVDRRTRCVMSYEDVRTTCQLPV